MKKLLLGILAVVTLVMAGCGGSVEVTVPIGPEPPSITLDGFTKNTSTEYISGSVHFYAPDSDIDSITTVVYNSGGYEISRVKTLLYLSGISAGTIPFSIDYVTYPSDFYAYTFSVYLTDFNGYTSNQAVGTFYVP